MAIAGLGMNVLAVDIDPDTGPARVANPRFSSVIVSDVRLRRVAAEGVTYADPACRSSSRGFRTDPEVPSSHSPRLPTIERVGTAPARTSTLSWHTGSGTKNGLWKSRRPT